MKKLFAFFIVYSNWLCAQIDPQLDWAFNGLNNSILGGTTSGKEIAVDANGNRYLIGSFQNTADFDPSVDTFNLIALNYSASFLAKYDSQGNFLWVKQLDADGYLFANDLTIDGNGNVFITGYFYNTIDFDPGADETIVSDSFGRSFVSKFDTNGNFTWVIQFSGYQGESKSISLDNSGNIFVTGTFRSIADFDPSQSSANITATGSDDIFIAKYTNNGDYLWAKRIGGTSYDYSNDLEVDNQGNVYTIGQYYGTADFDPGTGTYNLSAGSTYDSFISKLNSNGDFVWVKSFQGTGSNSFVRIEIDPFGNLLTTGAFSGSVDFDPGAATVTLTSNGLNDVFITKLDQNGNYIWVKIMGGTGTEKINGLSIDNIGNIYITGYFEASVDFNPGATINSLNSSNGSTFIAKYSSNGDYFWVKQLNVSECVTIKVDTYGNIHTIGTFSGTTDFNPDSGVNELNAGSMSHDCFISTLSQNGTYLYSFGIGTYSSWQLDEEGKDIAIDTQGNVYVIGSFQGRVDFDPSANTYLVDSEGMPGSYNAFVAKYNSNGALIWAKNIARGDYSSSGIGISVDQLGNVYAVGNFYGYFYFDQNGTSQFVNSNGANDGFITKLDPNGNFIWSKNIGGTGDDYISSFVLDNSENIYALGSFNGIADFDPTTGISNLTSVSYTDIFIAKYNCDGNLIWSKQLEGSDSDWGDDVAIDTQGNLIITGEFSGTIDLDPGVGVANPSGTSNSCFVLKLTSNGNYIWSNYYQNTAWPIKVTFDVNDNIICSGNFYGTVDFDSGTNIANLSSTQNSYNVFILKMNANGNYMWVKQIEGYGRLEIHDLKTDNLGNIYSTGNIELGNFDFDPGNGTQILNCIDSSDIIISKLDANGNFSWAEKIGSTVQNRGDAGYGINLDSFNNLYLTGYFSNEADFDPSSNTFNLSSCNRSDFFLAKFSQSALSGIDNTAEINNIRLFPNPTKGEINFIFDSPKYELIIRNILGEEIKKLAIENGESISIENLVAGTYIFELYSNKVKHNFKVIKY
jgi:hypothetical protein